MIAEKQLTIPLLPLRGMLIYPSVVLHLDVGRDKSVEALEKVMVNDHRIFLAAQKEMATEDPETTDIYEVGTISTVKQMLKLPNGTIRILVEGEQRAKITSFNKNDQYFEVNVEILEDDVEHDIETTALMRNVLDQFSGYIKLSKKITPEIMGTVSDIEDPSQLADVVASHLTLDRKSVV